MDEWKHRLWRWAVVRLFGGFWEVWPLAVCVHDDGLTIAWERIIKLDWRFVPAKTFRAMLRYSPPHKEQSDE